MLREGLRRAAIIASMPAEITSSANPRIRRLIGLKDRKNRDSESVFILEGAADIGKAIDAGLTPREIYYDPQAIDNNVYRTGTEVSVDEAVIARVSYRRRSQGVIAVFDQFATSLEALTFGPDPLVMVVEAIEKPGNLGAILRTADAVGAAAVIAADTSTDIFNPNVIRASVGAVFSVPVAVSDIEGTVRFLADRKLRLIAADPAASGAIWSVDLTGACALLVGSEHDGLSEIARSAADTLVSIPMRGTVDSLNTSVSAAILAYEALRQRA
jgi:TrmH family RNA methyltransferase